MKTSKKFPLLAAPNINAHHINRISCDSKNISSENPTLSIITVVYNAIETLEQTILSVLNQNAESLEYIIIDGGSRDGSLEIIKQYGNQIQFWLSEPDKGISDAINKGIRLSKGSIIGIIHADDWYEHGCFQKVLKQHMVFPNSIVHGNILYWKNNKPYYNAHADDRKLLHHMTIHHPTMFVPRSVYEAIGLFRIDFKYAMDHEWAMRAKVTDQKFLYIDDIISNMRIDGLSDRHWKTAYIESAIARFDLKVPFLLNIYFTSKSFLLTFTRKILENVGLSNILSWFRERYSIVKKHHR